MGHFLIPLNQIAAAKLKPHALAVDMRVGDGSLVKLVSSLMSLDIPDCSALTQGSELIAKTVIEFGLLILDLNVGRDGRKLLLLLKFSNS
jgi:hypothetical protein